ncbi:glycosyltransferase involved in cell wall biosynthesis [Inhella inkyongensis]|uniref:Glycosyltransferase involved in cell wall biosynthesis n=1 Tax=Inhella inkyongensis TaxID=392593 RepID=A0A840S508_9BURK|nr:glycosyltransferase family 4 protein [Inhella inkyongensis]MBB5204116.1 glycosyltransferase involved in cell wall biosynthesis [Inhella inkyongensis]
MRIAHLMLTRHFAGSERYAVELANAQAERHEVAMLLPKAAQGDSPQTWARHLDPRVQQIPLPNARWLQPWAARRALNAWQPEVAHAHLSLGCKALGGWRAPKTLRVATLHIEYKPQQHARLDALIAIAPWQLSALPALPTGLREHCEAIANWSKARPSSPGARERQRQQWGVGPDEFLIGTLGRAEQSKGWEVLLQAFEQAALPQARLVLVGQGRDWASLRKRAPQQVLMPGFTQAPQDCLAAFDLFVSAAHSEPFGLVFLEAMHAGLPILATRTEGAQFLGREFLGRVPVGDAAALADALRAAAAQRPARRTYRMDDFEPDAQIARIENFYQRERARLLAASA